MLIIPSFQHEDLEIHQSLYVQTLFGHDVVRFSVQYRQAAAAMFWCVESPTASKFFWLLMPSVWGNVCATMMMLWFMCIKRLSITRIGLFFCYII